MEVAVPDRSKIEARLVKLDFLIRRAEDLVLQQSKLVMRLHSSGKSPDSAEALLDLYCQSWKLLQEVRRRVYRNFLRSGNGGGH